jgi:hypothetical protein
MVRETPQPITRLLSQSVQYHSQSHASFHSQKNTTANRPQLKKDKTICLSDSSVVSIKNNNIPSNYLPNHRHGNNNNMRMMSGWRAALFPQRAGSTHWVLMSA